jgi:hypothetical protein
VLGLAILAVLATATQASASGVLLHTYRLSALSGLANDFGSHALTSHGGTIGHRPVGSGPCPGTLAYCEGYLFTAGQGLSVVGALGDADEYANDYSIVIDYFLDQTSSGLQKIVDLQGLCGLDSTCNSGLYLSGNLSGPRLTVYDDGGTAYTGATTGQAANVLSRVALTRTAGGTVSVYENGIPSLSFSDADSDAVFTGPNAIINLFMDDLFAGNAGGGGVATVPASGFVNSVRIYGGALTAAQVAGLAGVVDIVEDGPPAPPVPEPACCSSEQAWPSDYSG